MAMQFPFASPRKNDVSANYNHPFYYKRAYKSSYSVFKPLSSWQRGLHNGSETHKDTRTHWHSCNSLAPPDAKTLFLPTIIIHFNATELANHPMLFSEHESHEKREETFPDFTFITDGTVHHADMSAFGKRTVQSTPIDYVLRQNRQNWQTFRILPIAKTSVAGYGNFKICIWIINRTKRVWLQQHLGMYSNVWNVCVIKII